MTIIVSGVTFTGERPGHAFLNVRLEKSEVSQQAPCDLLCGMCLESSQKELSELRCLAKHFTKLNGSISEEKLCVLIRKKMLNNTESGDRFNYCQRPPQSDFQKSSRWCLK